MRNDQQKHALGQNKVALPRYAPFSVEYVTDVLRQLRRHSKYKGQTIFAVEQDGNAIAMRDGDVISLGKYVLSINK